MTDTKVFNPSEVRAGLFYGYIVVIAATCIMVVVWGTFHAFGIFFKPMLAEFGWSRAMLSGAFALSMFCQGVFAIIVGRLTDQFGARIVMTICGFLLTAGYLLMSRVHSTWHLYVVYGGLIGIGMSGSFVALTSTVARWFVKRRGLMTGIIMSGSGIGSLISAPVATRLIAAYHWRIAYLLIGGTVLVVVTAASYFLMRDPARVGQMPYGGSPADQGRSTGTSGLSVETAIYTPPFYMLSVMFFCFGFSMFAFTVHIVPHASGLGFPAVTAANVLAVIGCFIIVGRLALGLVGDTFGHRWVFVIGFILAAASSLWLLQATEISSLYLFAAAFGFAGGGMGTSQSPLVADIFGLKAHGLILAITNLGFAMGGAVGPLTAGYLFDLTGSYQVSFLGCSVFSLLGLILTLFLRAAKENPSRTLGHSPVL